MVTAISDSLIDQEVRHRFLLTNSSYELHLGLLRLFAYVLHPEMVDCFKNHYLRVSRFGLRTTDVTAIVHITLRSWARKEDPTSFDARKEDDKIHLPANLEKSWKLKEKARLRKEKGKSAQNTNAKPDVPRDLEGGGGSEKPPEMELRVSSIGMSTNEFGDFSKCSVVTDLIHPNDIAALGRQAQEIWNGFVHQPQTGRFLVFSRVLGLLCKGIVTHYQEALLEFVTKMQLEQELPTYLKDPGELRSGDADAELRLSLWSLEALYKMSNTLAMSVKAIEEAIEDVKREVQKVEKLRQRPSLPRQRPPPLTILPGPGREKPRTGKHVPRPHRDVREELFGSHGDSVKARAEGGIKLAVL
ncbi:hypothetical protein B0T24DRAFT_218093 [Lasiosphaeria ovina]|uniref:Uncharacterized protein n=1 Tax=Lasiosphaeria ovina TaxID=92902 RepID=A0AAE0NA15_9PEZI|nr:hypothetical protein B0T24DRAFT_218093 [Lasiosphaeria ovina]